jgi:DNA-binding PadR family transcriptional regulator
MSGYDIKRMLDSLDWLISGPSYGSLYPALHSLLEDALVTVDVENNQGGPSRKLYSITETGQQALQEWVDQPAEPGASLKAFLKRLILADSFSHRRLLDHLNQRRMQVATHQETLRQMAAGDAQARDLGPSLAYDYGLAIARAELAWLEEILQQLSHSSGNGGKGKDSGPAA